MDTQQFHHFNAGEVLHPIRGYPERDIDWFQATILLDITTLIDDNRISDGLLVDIGCAKGYFTRYYANLFKQVTGIDFAETRIDSAIAFHKNADPRISSNLSFGVVDISVPLPDGFQEFNTAVTSAVIQHINPKARDQVFKNIYRMLVPGGKLVLYEAFIETQRNKGLYETTHAWNGNIELLSLTFLRSLPFFTVDSVDYIANSGGDFHIYRVIMQRTP